MGLTTDTVPGLHIESDQQQAQAAQAAPNTTNPVVRLECNIPGIARWRVANAVFELDDRYELVRFIGRGAGCTVCVARDTATGKRVAIKKMHDPFQDASTIHREMKAIRLSRLLGSHENMLGMRVLSGPSSNEAFASPGAARDVYMVATLMDTDLHRVVRSRQALTTEHCQFFMYQILCALKYMHSAGVVHTDLKPHNVLLNTECTLKLTDLSGAAANGHVRGMDECIMARWYRAPELLLGASQVTPAVDMWSAGCIMGEILGRQPMFTGRDYLDQIGLHVRALGRPGDDAIEWVQSQRARAYLASLPNSPPTNWAEKYPAAGPHAIDLLLRLLDLNPRTRITAAEALAHPWLAELHDEAHEPSAPERVDWSFDQPGTDMAHCQALLLHELCEQGGAPGGGGSNSSLQWP